MNFGHFEGRVTATWHDDGRDMTLTAPFAYIDRADVRWDAAVGSVVNGASIPRAFWTVIGSPFTGRFRNASVVHDVACVDRTRPWKQVHQMFYEACRCSRTNVVQAKTMYYAVYHFGPRWRVDGRMLLGAMPPPPSPRQVAAITAWFREHDVDADEIPELNLKDVSSGKVYRFRGS
jgi:hypothetical protein